MPTRPHDNLVNPQPPGPGTHALIIGVSHYRHLEDGGEPTDDGRASQLKQLSSAARSAAEFGAWLLKHYHHPNCPLQSLRVLLSPSQGEVIPQAIDELIDGDHSATKDHVEAALAAFITDCKKDTDNIAIVYVAGHGVQITKQGVLVLLEDFGADSHVLRKLDGALNMLSLNRGMNGNGFPNQQFWFVDACRQPPAIAQRFERLQGGIEIDEPNGSVASTPMYLATVTGASAYGVPGGSSIFSMALLWCLEKAYGCEEPGDLFDGWHVSVTSLSVAVPKKVQAIANDYSAEQAVEVAGCPIEGLFHGYSKAPEVEVELQLVPDAAQPGERKLLDENYTPIPLPSNSWPLKTKLLPGLYSIQVTPSPPYREIGKLMNLKPPRHFGMIEVIL